MMAGPDKNGTKRDGWEQIKTLGTGGFGTVTLWTNKVQEIFNFHFTLVLRAVKNFVICARQISAGLVKF